MFNEADSLTIDGIDQILRVSFLSSILQKATNFFRARRVEKDMKGVRLLLQEERCAAADHYGIPFLSNFWSDLLHHRYHTVGVEDLIFQHGAALVAAAPKSLGQAVKTAVHTLVAAHDGGTIDLCHAGDLFGAAVVPQPPPQALGP